MDESATYSQQAQLQFFEDIARRLSRTVSNPHLRRLFEYVLESYDGGPTQDLKGLSEFALGLARGRADLKLVTETCDARYAETAQALVEQLTPRNERLNAWRERFGIPSRHEQQRMALEQELYYAVWPALQPFAYQREGQLKRRFGSAFAALLGDKTLPKTITSRLVLCVQTLESPDPKVQVQVADEVRDLVSDLITQSPARSSVSVDVVGRVLKELEPCLAPEERVLRTAAKERIRALEGQRPAVERLKEQLKDWAKHALSFGAGAEDIRRINRALKHFQISIPRGATVERYHVRPKGAAVAPAFHMAVLRAETKELEKYVKERLVELERSSKDAQRAPRKGTSSVDELYARINPDIVSPAHHNADGRVSKTELVGRRTAP